MKTSSKGIDFIKSFETLRLKAYKAVKSEKYYTIGYGHYGPDVEPGMEITENEAERMLAEDLADFERCVSRSTAGWNLKQCQFDALVSLAFNVGVNAFQNSTLLKLVKQGASEDVIRNEFGRWCHSGGRVLPGLQRRRQAEADMYFSCVKESIMGKFPEISPVFLILFMLATSCGPGKHLPAQTEHRDSVRVEVREVTKFIRDTVWMQIPIQSAENTTRDTSSHLETDFAESDARINPDGTLHHSLRNKEQEKPVPVDVPTTQKDSIVYRDKFIYETIEVERDLTGWQKWQMRSFWILLSGLLMFILRKPLLALIRRFI